MVEIKENATIISLLFLKADGLEMKKIFLEMRLVTVSNIKNIHTKGNMKK
jgi:hypothetical protein